MNRDEQDRRRALKHERKALDRAVTSGAFRSVTAAELPTRWNHARRARAISSRHHLAEQTARARLREIAEQLRTPSPEERTK